MSVSEKGRRTAAARGLGPWLARIAPRSAKGHVGIAILSDREVRALNRQYRRKDAVTDVLSFPAGAYAPGVLGDIVIAKGKAEKQAGFLGHSMAVELRVLALHGLLHLLGYDHETDRGRMARMETRLRRRAGLPPGLIARSS